MKSIKLENISKRYGPGSTGTWAVRDVSLEIEKGEFFFLLGPSGCGKTTLLRMIAGLIEPTEGTIRLGDRDVTHVSVEDRHTAMVFQNYALWPHMTVQRNVEFGPRMRRVSRRDAKGRARDCLATVRMEDYHARKPNQLSGGQQQRVALARALAARADCLLLDEPLSNLDAKLRSQMRAELRALVKGSGATAVYVTHDQKEALSMADRIAVMHAGHMVQQGAPQELYNRPATRFVADFLGEANFLEGRVRQAGSTTSVETPAGVILAETGGTFCEAQQVTCCVRPERVNISPADGAGDTGVEATIESEVYLGELRQFLCRLKSGQPWRVSMLGTIESRFAPGQAVRLSADARDVSLLTE
ncbi:MAG: ABC transporter ATP-binding protein [Phycisphaerae bacterium]